jgi:hypothetical protein
MAYDKCLRCGRKLKDPISKQLGLGKTCAKAVNGIYSPAKVKFKRLPKGLKRNPLFDAGGQNGSN